MVVLADKELRIRKVRGCFGCNWLFETNTEMRYINVAQGRDYKRGYFCKRCSERLESTESLFSQEPGFLYTAVDIYGYIQFYTREENQHLAPINFIETIEELRQTALAQSSLPAILRNLGSDPASQEANRQRLAQRMLNRPIYVSNPSSESGLYARWIDSSSATTTITNSNYTF
jgi:hypothetical protein